MCCIHEAVGSQWRETRWWKISVLGTRMRRILPSMLQCGSHSCYVDTSTGILKESNLSTGVKFFGQLPENSAMWENVKACKPSEGGLDVKQRCQHHHQQQVVYRLRHLPENTLRLTKTGKCSHLIITMVCLHFWLAWRRTNLLLVLCTGSPFWTLSAWSVLIFAWW